MTTITTTTTEVQTPGDSAGFDEAQLAAAAFLARYRGRTLEAYRHDLRGFFQWTADHDITVLAATRPHIELWRTAMEQQGLPRQRPTADSPPCAASTGTPTSTAASRRTRPSTSVAPRSTPPRAGAWTAPSSECSCPQPSTTTTPTRRSQRCSGSTDSGSARLVRPTSRISPSSEAIGSCASPAKATSPQRSPSFRAPPARLILPLASATRARSCADGTGSGSTDVPRTAGSARSASGPASDTSTLTCSAQWSGWTTSVMRSSVS